MNESILFVDDEKQILNSLRRVFATGEYRVFFAESGEEALSILAEEEINLLITDVRMPGMSGVELLTAVKKKYPSIIRMVLSGYADESMVIQIQQDSLAKRYLPKPWKNEELRLSVKQVFAVEKVLRSKNIMELVNRIDFLPSPGNIYHQFSLLLEQDAGMNEIAKVIESDQSITAKILQVANSALYGLNTGSVRQAITYLGLTNVKRILLYAASYNHNICKNSRINIDIEKFWKHAVTTNQILAYLYRQVMGHSIPELCSMAGLLHDIGKVVFINNFSGKYLKAAAAINNVKDFYYYYEQMEFIDITHQEMGAYLLNWWELPPIIVETTLYHHQPLDENVTDKKLVSMLHIADVYSWNYICGTENWSVDPEVLNYLALSKQDEKHIFNEIMTNRIVLQ